MLISGCSQPKPPECFSPETTTALRQIIAGMGGGSRHPRASKEAMADLITIEAAAPTAYDESIQRFTCQAQVSVPDRIPPHESITPETDRETAMMIIEMSAAAAASGSICGTSCSDMIQYTSQLANKEHIVSVTGLPAGMSVALALVAHVAAADAAAKPKLDAIKSAITSNANQSVEADGETQSAAIYVPNAGVNISAVGTRGGIKTLVNHKGERLYARSVTIDPPALFNDDGACGEKVVSEMLILGDVDGAEGDRVSFKGTAICEPRAGYIVTDPAK